MMAQAVASLTHTQADLDEVPSYSPVQPSLDY